MPGAARGADISSREVLARHAVRAPLETVKHRTL
jgi:hypothetical protein